MTSPTLSAAETPLADLVDSALREMATGRWSMMLQEKGYFGASMRRNPDVVKEIARRVLDTPREGGADEPGLTSPEAIRNLIGMVRSEAAGWRDSSLDLQRNPDDEAAFYDVIADTLTALQAGQAAPVGVKHWHISFANGGNGYTDDAAFARDEYANGSKVTPLPTYEDLAVFALGRIHNGNRIQELKKSALDALNTISVSKRRRDALRALAATPPAPTAAVDGEALATREEPVAHAYILDGECEEISWGAPPIDGNPSLIPLFSKAPQKSMALRDKLLSCVCLLETMAEWAAEEGHEIEHVMMSVMAKSGREVLDAS